MTDTLAISRGWHGLISGHHRDFHGLDIAVEDESFWRTPSQNWNGAMRISIYRRHCWGGRAELLAGPYALPGRPLHELALAALGERGEPMPLAIFLDRLVDLVGHWWPELGRVVGQIDLKAPAHA